MADNNPYSWDNIQKNSSKYYASDFWNWLTKPSDFKVYGGMGRGIPSDVVNTINSGATNESNQAQNADQNRWINMGNAYTNAITDQSAPAMDPFLASLYSLIGKNTADTSGYDAALGSIAKQRQQAQKRYQTYSAQISDLFGNLGRKSDTYAQEQAAITESAAASRAQAAAMQAQLAQQTRDADAARLKAANEARIALGGEAAGPTGDIATQNIEKALTDQQAVGQTTIDTILANEALAKLMSSRQAGGFDIAGQQAQQQLNMSYEDLLASLAGQEAQTKMQKSQAISAGAMSPSEQISILQAAENYKNAQASAGTGSDPATTWIKANPKSAQPALSLLGYFAPWFMSEAPAVGMTGKTPTLNEIVTTFTKANPEAKQILDKNPTLYDLLQKYTGLK